MKSFPPAESHSCKKSMKIMVPPKSGLSLTRLLLAFCASVCIQLTLARAADPITTVTTDQEEYPPFSIVWIKGTGFQPSETVSNQVVQIAGPNEGAA